MIPAEKQLNKALENAKIKVFQWLARRSMFRISNSVQISELFLGAFFGVQCTVVIESSIAELGVFLFFGLFFRSGRLWSSLHGLGRIGAISQVTPN